MAILYLSCLCFIIHIEAFGWVCTFVRVLIWLVKQKYLSSKETAAFIMSACLSGGGGGGGMGQYHMNNVRCCYALDIWNNVLDIWNNVLDIWNNVSDIWINVLDTCNHVLYVSVTMCMDIATIGKDPVCYI